MITRNGLLFGVIAAVLFAFTPLASAGNHGGGGGHGGGAHFSGSAGGFRGGGFNRAGGFNRSASLNGRGSFNRAGGFNEMVVSTARPASAVTVTLLTVAILITTIVTTITTITMATSFSTIRFTTAGASLITDTDTITAMVTRAMKLTRLVITKVATATRVILWKWMCRARWPIVDIIAERSMASSETAHAGRFGRFSGMWVCPLRAASIRVC